MLTPKEVEDLRQRAAEDLQKLLVMARERHAAEKEAETMARNAAHASFEEGKIYSRREIHDVLGGGIQDYLPHKDGEVVCGCFRLDSNPEAPQIVLVGDAPQVKRWAEVFSKQAHYVPIFIKAESNVWKCVGNFRVEKSVEDRTEIKNYEPKAGRDGVVMILKLVKAPA